MSCISAHAGQELRRTLSIQNGILWVALCLFMSPPTESLGYQVKKPGDPNETQRAILTAGLVTDRVRPEQVGTDSSFCTSINPLKSRKTKLEWPKITVSKRMEAWIFLPEKCKCRHQPKSGDALDSHSCPSETPTIALLPGFASDKATLVSYAEAFSEEGIVTYLLDQPLSLSGKDEIGDIWQHEDQLTTRAINSVSDLQRNDGPLLVAAFSYGANLIKRVQNCIRVNGIILMDPILQLPERPEVIRQLLLTSSLGTLGDGDLIGAIQQMKKKQHLCEARHQEKRNSVGRLTIVGSWQEEHIKPQGGSRGETIEVDSSHVGFVLSSRDQVITAMLKFIEEIK